MSSSFCDTPRGTHSWVPFKSPERHIDIEGSRFLEWNWWETLADWAQSTKVEEFLATNIRTPFSYIQHFTACHCTRHRGHNARNVWSPRCWTLPLGSTLGWIYGLKIWGKFSSSIHMSCLLWSFNFAWNLETVSLVQLYTGDQRDVEGIPSAMADDNGCCEKYVVPNDNDSCGCKTWKIMLDCMLCMLVTLLTMFGYFLLSAPFAWAAEWVDHKTGGDPVLTSHFDYSLAQASVVGSISARVQNHSAMPVVCADVIPLDAVSNISVAENCTAWCHEALGPNSATPYMASPFHMAMILQSHESSVYMTCFKTQTSWWALQVMPEWYYV